MEAHADLREINARIADAERQRDAAYLEGVLHDELVFRRADGSLATKRDYLDAVPKRRYDRLESDVVEVHEKGDSAVVTVIVDAAGQTQDGTAFGGRFRNVRVFVRDGGGWRCRIWVNTPADA
jgi:ketosteroid isomerase-like protein